MNDTVETLNDSKKKTSRLKYTIPTAVFLTIIAALINIYFTQEPNAKPDPTHERIIREIAGEQLNKHPYRLTDEDFAQITEFNLAGIKGIPKELSDLKFLSKFTNLQRLYISWIRYPDNRIPKWIKVLAKLGVYDLEERFAMDLSPIENLTNLQTLSLSSIYANNIKPIANLKNLKELRLENTHVRDIMPLANLTNLNWLLISHTQASDIKPLSNLKNLRGLILANTNFSDEQIAELKKALPNAVIDVRKSY